MGWRNAQASVQLIAEVNARWPGRDRSSDGTIGDAAHAARTSDHNPWLQEGGQGVVRARDIDKDGIDAPWLAEYLRQLGVRGDRRLAPGGYIIFNRRITTPTFSGWKAYTGSNPHTKHVHVSFSTDPGVGGFDSTAGWGITNAAAPAPAAGPASLPSLELGQSGPAVASLQRFLNAYAWRPAVPRVTADGAFGPKTAAALAAAQQRMGITGGDGRNVGPQTKAGLWSRGWRG